MASKKLSGCLGIVLVIAALVILAPSLSRCGKARQEQAAPARAAPAPLTPEQEAAKAEGEAALKAAETRAQAALDTAVASAKAVLPKGVKPKAEAALPKSEKLQCDVETTQWLWPEDRPGGTGAREWPGGTRTRAWPEVDRTSDRMTVTISTTGSKDIPEGRVGGVRVIKGVGDPSNQEGIDFEMTAELFWGAPPREGKFSLDNSDSGSWRMVRDYRPARTSAPLEPPGGRVLIENLEIDRNTGNLLYESITKGGYMFQTKVHGPCKKATQRKPSPASSPR